MAYERKFDTRCLYDRFKETANKSYWVEELSDAKVEPSAEQMKLIRNIILHVMIAGLNGMSVEDLRALKVILMNQHLRTSESPYNDLDRDKMAFFDAVDLSTVKRWLAIDPEQTFYEVSDLFPSLSTDSIYSIVLSNLAEEQLATLAKQYGC